MQGLMLHCGGQAATIHEVYNSPTPAQTDTWKPLPHGRVIDTVMDELENVGLRVTDAAHGLHRVNGDDLRTNYFGLFEVKGDGVVFDDRSMIVGLRNAHTKNFGIQIALGEQVFVCDNLAFYGSIMASRRHTVHVEDSEIGFRPRIVEAISRLKTVAGVQEQRVETYKRTNMDNGLAEQTIIDAYRQGVINPVQIGKVVEQWDTPDHEEFARNRNAWRLFNAVTESMKGSRLTTLQDRTQRLHDVMDNVCEFALAA